MAGQVALLGKPLRRRHSQVMHDAAFAAAGIDARYVLEELDEAEVPARSRRPWARARPRRHGAVQAARGDAPRRGRGRRAAIGAVNNVVRTDDGRLVGINTDAPGFRAGAELAMGFPLDGRGGGGRGRRAARAVVHALLGAGVAQAAPWPTGPAPRQTRGRTGAAADGAGPATALESEAFVKAPGSADLAVNATTVGMVDPGATIPVERLPEWATVFDLVYVPAETPLIAAARGEGLRRRTARRC